MRVNLQTQVNSAAIRRETDADGREHVVLPSYTLPANVVMNGGMYPSQEIDAHYAKIEGTLAPLGHPMVNGQFVSAFSPEGINRAHIGAWNRNVKKVGNRVYAEKWVDVEVAQRTEGGRRLMERVEAIERGEAAEPIHTSIALLLEKRPAPKGMAYNWVAKIHDIDHDAILLDQPGAATPEQGVGLFVNTADAVPVPTVNAGALTGESYRDKERLLQDAAQARWTQPTGGDNQYVWVSDFTDSEVVIIRNGGLAERYTYERDGNQITFGDEGVPVSRKETWVEKGKAVMTNALRAIGFFNNQASPENSEGADMPITAEERAAIVADLKEAITPIIKANMAEAIQPVADQVKALETNQKAIGDAVTANARAAEASMRAAVEAKFGKTVAEALTGNALKEMFDKCGQTEGLNVNGKQDTENQFAPPAATDYFGQPAKV